MAFHYIKPHLAKKVFKNRKFQFIFYVRTAFINLLPTDSLDATLRLQKGLLTPFFAASAKASICRS